MAHVDIVGTHPRYMVTTAFCSVSTISPDDLSQYQCKRFLLNAQDVLSSVDGSLGLEYLLPSSRDKVTSSNQASGRTSCSPLAPLATEPQPTTQRPTIWSKCFTGNSRPLVVHPPGAQVDNLPLVLLSIRSTMREEEGFSAAELTQRYV